MATCGCPGTRVKKRLTLIGPNRRAAANWVIGGQRLAAEKHHAVCRVCIGDGLHLFIGHGLQVDTVDLRAAAVVPGSDFHFS